MRKKQKYLCACVGVCMMNLNFKEPLILSQKYFSSGT
jgi:hypothetical protein